METATNRNQSNEFSFADIIKFFKGKVKALIILSLVSAIIGGALGFAFSLIFVEYGTELSFRVTPADDSTQLMYILNSEHFAEQLLLEENGLPKKSEVTDKVAYDKAEAAIKEYEQLRQEKREVVFKMDKISYELNISAIDRRYSELSSEYTRISNLLDTYKLVYAESVATPEHIAKISELENQLAVALAEKQKYEVEVYRPSHSQISLVQNEYNLLKANCTEKRLEAEELAEVVLSEWRETDNVKEMVSLITSGVTCKYTAWAEELPAKSTESESLENRGFITVTVKLNCEKETAEFIVDRLKDRLPSFVEKSVESINAVSNVVCYSMSPYAESEFLSLGDIVKTTFMFGVVAFVLVIGIYCSTVVLKNMFPSDKNGSKKSLDSQNTTNK